jgi:hypothetical protein
VLDRRLSTHRRPRPMCLRNTLSAAHAAQVLITY